VSAPDNARAERIAELDHELRTPLAAIVGYAELLEARGDEKTRLEAARMISTSAERLGTALDCLLAELAQ
jgi:two-component system sensor histidine kinase BarA